MVYSLTKHLTLQLPGPCSLCSISRMPEAPSLVSLALKNELQSCRLAHVQPVLGSSAGHPWLIQENTPDMPSDGSVQVGGRLAPVHVAYTVLLNQTAAHGVPTALNSNLVHD